MAEPQPAPPPPPGRAWANAPAQEMDAVLDRARRLFEREEVSLERRAALAAAEELGIPPAYLERAAAELHAERAARIRAQRRRRRLTWGTLAALTLLAAAAGGGYLVTREEPRPPIAVAAVAEPREGWRLNLNAGSSAALITAERDGHAVPGVRVDQFAAPAGDAEGYFVNLDSVTGPLLLRGYDQLTFAVRGSGLPLVRVYLEASATERWRSPAIPVTEAWTVHTLALDRFERQIRDSTSAPWRTVAYRAPGRVERLSFKLGGFINDITARGEIVFDAVRVEQRR